MFDIAPADEQKLGQLRAYLDSSAGGTLDAGQLGRLLAFCWNLFDAGADTSMKAGKLAKRIEDPSRRPPILEFSIERHGPTALGSPTSSMKSDGSCTQWISAWT